MRYLLKLPFLFILAVFASLTVKADDFTPEIIFPRPGQDCILSGISDNGHWAVYGSNIVDITVNPFEFRNIGGSCRDISDDGKTVVGSNGGPAVWKEGIGWKRLPIPAGTRGGNALKVTPDGRYAVGVVSLGVVNSSDGVMWDLDNLSIVELPDRPMEDRAAHTPYPNTYQNQYDNISGDGRYVQGTLAWSYMGDQTAYVYDRETQQTHYVGYKKKADGTFTPDDPLLHYTECEGMSGDGHYVTGPAYILQNGEYLTAYRYDVWNDTFEYYDKDIQPDSWGFAVSNDGLVFLRKTAYNPYSDGYVCYNNFYYAFKDILEIGYGINLEKYGIDNTGVPCICSADGRTLLFINSPQSSYVVKFKEDLKDVCERLELLRNWTSSPRSGSVMSKLSLVTMEFSYLVETSPTGFTKIGLYDENDNLVANPLAQGGLYANGNSLNVTFRTLTLAPDKEYTLRIPTGICHVKGLPNNINQEIEIKFIGRKEGPVAVESITPESGSTLTSLSLQTDPILVKFDADIKQNATLQDPILMYIDDNPDPTAYLYAGLYNANTLAIFPSNEQPLYTGSRYTIKVPAGIVTDISGYGASEAFEIEYSGNYIPQFGNDDYIFKSNCDNWDNFLFYEGDHGNPTSEYLGMGFTADTTPWWVVRDNENSTDLAFASHSSYTDYRQANDWVMTRQLYIPDNTVCLDFDGQSYRKNKEDYLKIYVYVSDALINSLSAATVEQIQELGDLIFNEKLDPGATEGGLDDEWTHYKLSLEKYAGKNIYIAFVNQNQDQSMVMIDNILVSRVIDSFVALTTPSNVIAKESQEIKGYVKVENPQADYSSLSMQLFDSEGSLISSISANGLSLKGGDAYQFEFPEALPLTIGEDNKFTIKFKLEDYSDEYAGSIKDLVFEPVKRVVLEEFTGRDCQFCPQGHAMIERLGEMFGNSFIPIGLYCYNGTDPKGLGVMDYWSYLGMTAAPSARVNRRPTSMSLVYVNPLDRYIYSKTEYPDADLEPLWYDDVVAELAEPTYLDISVEKTSAGNSSELTYVATVKSAVHLENQNIRVFGVLLENGLFDYQVNAMYDTSDPLLGEWGKGGALGSSVAQTTFNHVARATWGRGYNGTANLIPVTLYPGAVYSVDISLDNLQYVDKIENCEFVVILIDGNTGRILNAATEGDTTAIKEAVENALNSVSVAAVNGEIQVVSAEDATVQVFTAAGQLLGTAMGRDSFTINLNGYHGVVMVRVQTASGALTRKIIL